MGLAALCLVAQCTAAPSEPSMRPLDATACGHPKFGLPASVTQLKLFTNQQEPNPANHAAKEQGVCHTCDDMTHEIKAHYWCNREDVCRNSMFCHTCYKVKAKEDWHWPWEKGPWPKVLKMKPCKWDQEARGGSGACLLERDCKRKKEECDAECAAKPGGCPDKTKLYTHTQAQEWPTAFSGGGKNASALHVLARAGAAAPGAPSATWCAHDLARNNNGAVSCAAYCEGEWEGAGKACAGARWKDGQNASCADAGLLHNGGGLDCCCRPPPAVSPDVVAVASANAAKAAKQRSEKNRLAATTATRLAKEKNAAWREADAHEIARMQEELPLGETLNGSETQGSKPPHWLSGGQWCRQNCIFCQACKMGYTGFFFDDYDDAVGQPMRQSCTSRPLRKRCAECEALVETLEKRKPSEPASLAPKFAVLPCAPDMAALFTYLSDYGREWALDAPSVASEAGAVRRCEAECVRLGYPCSSATAGVDGQLSCPQACMMRFRHVTYEVCNEACEEPASNTSCSRTVAGFRYPLCGGCTEGTIPSPIGCKAGCYMMPAANAILGAANE